MPIDVKIFYFFNNLADRGLILDQLFIFFGYYFPYFLTVAFLLLLFSKQFKGNKTKVFFTALISVILSRFVITEIIRFLYCRPRPFMAYAVNRLVEDTNCSFPSGHAAFFFALAMAIYFYDKKWGAWFFVVAILIALARVIAGVHYPADILVGAVIGVLSAYAVFYFIKK